VLLAAARYSSTTPSTISTLARPRIERARHVGVIDGSAVGSVVGDGERVVGGLTEGLPAPGRSSR